jgi:hypothetical protein
LYGRNYPNKFREVWERLRGKLFQKMINDD